jgi:hypothetical protein
VPYYANALVVAYRSDKLQKTTSIPLQTSKRLRLTSWTELLEVLAKVEDWRGPKFACDRSAVETGACLLLDSLVPQKSWDAFAKKPADTLESLLKESGNMAKASEVLTALRDLGLTAETPGEELPLDALVYVCWYSQLRDVILRSAKRKGENAGSSGHIIEDLTRKLGVCALPCGGFTGDWYIGVIYGSVSISLGLDLVEMLCDPKEELKRLGQGVGLPTLEKFYNASFSAWPESKAMLSRLGTIHANARSRAEIIGYPVMKNALYGAWNELCAKVTVGSILRRLPKRMKALEVLSRRAEPPKLS